MFMDHLKSAERVMTEDALKHIYKCEMKGRRPTVQSVAGALEIPLDEVADLLDTMAGVDLLQMQGDEFSLTSKGQQFAVQVIRAHRLWERYLADQTGFDQAEWHKQAEQHEHRLTPAEMEQLSAQLGHPTHDPHGDPIPTAEGELVSHGGQPLTSLAVGQPARIVHVEDEPTLVYSQLVAAGLHPGMAVRLTEVTPERVRFRADDQEHVLAPVFAANIAVVPLPDDQTRDLETTQRLSQLEPGQRGQVVSISAACRGPERRRFMDLGILPGTTITAEMRSPGGDPTAYNIRDALIALRKDQANLIHINRLEENNQ